MNTMTFSTVALYKAAKASGGDIYNALVNSTKASDTIVSFITDIGQTAIDTMNPIVEEPYGDIGDTLLYCSTDSKFYWLKSRAGINAGTVGCAFAVMSKLTNYAIIGVLIHRVKDEGLIMSDSLGGIPWCRTNSYVDSSDQSKWAITFTNMPNIQHARTRKSINRHQAYASLGLDMRERLGEGYNQYSNPFPRSAWNAMMSAYQAGSVTASNASGGTTYDTTANWTWKVEKVAVSGLTGNTLKATFNFKTSQGAQTNGFDPADWDFKFDNWYRDCMELYAVSPCSAAYEGSTLELTGRENTRRMLEFISTYNSGKTSDNQINATASGNCAVACDQYYKIATDNATFGQHKWWLPDLTELAYATLNDKMLYRKGIDLSGTYIWSSTQCSQGNAFLADTTSSDMMSNYGYKYYGFTVRAVSAYQFPNS